jgi:hypothetical protein
MLQLQQQLIHKWNIERKTFNLFSKYFSSLPFFFRLQMFALTEKTYYLGGARSNIFKKAGVPLGGAQPFLCWG